MQQAAGEFRQCAPAGPECRMALCRYLSRGMKAGFSHGELSDFLGETALSVLERAGYSHDATQRVMQMLGSITDEEIQKASRDA